MMMIKRKSKALLKVCVISDRIVSVSRPCQYFHSKMLKFKRSPCTGYHFQAVGV